MIVYIVHFNNFIIVCKKVCTTTFPVVCGAEPSLLQPIRFVHAECETIDTH